MTAPVLSKSICAQKTCCRYPNLAATPKRERAQSSPINKAQAELVGKSHPEPTEAGL